MLPSLTVLAVLLLSTLANRAVGGALPPCTSLASAQRGSWELSDVLDTSGAPPANASSNFCAVESSHRCPARRRGVFISTECVTRPVEASLALLGNATVVFVGDSLTRQLRDTIDCSSEHFGNSRITTEFWRSFFLGHPGTPCHAERCSNDTFLSSCLAFDKDCGVTCSGCAAALAAWALIGTPQASESVSDFGTAWVERAEHRADVRFVVFGTGAWWSPFHGLADPLRQYAAMLAWLEPVLLRLVVAGKRLIWMGSPPMEPPFPNPQYGHQARASGTASSCGPGGWAMMRQQKAKAR